MSHIRYECIDLFKISCDKGQVLEKQTGPEISGCPCVRVSRARDTSGLSALPGHGATPCTLHASNFDSMSPVVNLTQTQKALILHYVPNRNVCNHQSWKSAQIGAG